MMNKSFSGVVCATVVAACGSSVGNQNEQGLDTKVQASSVFAVYEPTGEGGDGALFEGTLVLEEECLYVRSTSSRILPAFPVESSSWDAASQQLTVAGTTVTVGQHVGLGGGEAGTDSYSAPSHCDVGSVWITHSLVSP